MHPFCVQLVLCSILNNHIPSGFAVSLEDLRCMPGLAEARPGITITFLLFRQCVDAPRVCQFRDKAKRVSKKVIFITFKIGTGKTPFFPK
jgi:hypothetical protein